MEPTLSIPGIIGGVIAAAVGLATFYSLTKTHPELRLSFVALIIVLAALGWAWLAGANVSLPPEPVVVPPPPEPSSAPQPRPTATSMPDRQPLPQVVWLAVPGVGDVAAFRISQTEVTNGQYAQCVQAGQCRAPQITDEYDRPQFRDFPVVHVTRAQAHEYAAWLGAALPTEAQWLLACRGDDGRTHPWGSEPPDANLANYDSIIGRTTAVGFYGAGASPSGALDMVGNVWEWVEPDDGEDGWDIVRGGPFNFANVGKMSANCLVVCYNDPKAGGMNEHTLSDS